MLEPHTLLNFGDRENDFVHRTNRLSHLFLLLFWSALGCSSNLLGDQKANDALKALQILKSRVTVGTERSTYYSSLAEMDVATSAFLDSDGAKQFSKFSGALAEARKWYLAGGAVWNAQVAKVSYLGYCSPKSPDAFSVENLCRTYPEFVTSVPGKAPTSGTSSTFNSSLIDLDVEIAVLQAAKRKPYEHSRGIVYELAIQDAWKRASVATAHAQQLLTGKNEVSKESGSPGWTQEEQMMYLAKASKANIERSR